MVVSFKSTLPPRATSTSITPTTVKFLCSYGGMILPRYPDGKLRYHGGETRVLAVDRSISYAELTVKLGELCGTSVSLRCQLPTEDLDALVSITSDEDLANLIEEYDKAPEPMSFLKIRAFLSPPKSVKKISPPTSIASSSRTSLSSMSSYTTPRYLMPLADRCLHQLPKPVVFMEKSGGKMPPVHGHGYYAHANPTGHVYLIHNGNHWQ